MKRCAMLLVLSTLALGCGRTNPDLEPTLTVHPGPTMPPLDDDTEGNTDGEDPTPTPISPSDDPSVEDPPDGGMGDDDTADGGTDGGDPDTGTDGDDPDAGTDGDDPDAGDGDDPDGEPDAGDDDASDGGTSDGGDPDTGTDGGPDVGPMPGDPCVSTHPCQFNKVVQADGSCVGTLFEPEANSAAGEFGVCNPSGVLLPFDGQVVGLSTPGLPEELEPGLVVDQCVTVDFGQVQPVLSLVLLVASSPTACSMVCSLAEEDEEQCYGEASLVVGLGADSVTWDEFVLLNVNDFEHNQVILPLATPVSARYVLLCRESGAASPLDVSVDYLRVDMHADGITCLP